MMGRCIEKGREKCDHYWPYDTEPVYYGDIQVAVFINIVKIATIFLITFLILIIILILIIVTFLIHQVTILNESHFPDWNINEFRMMRGDTVSSIHSYR